MDVKNHDLGGVIARSCKGRKIVDAICIHGTEIQGREVHVKSEVQAFRIESGVDFKN